VRHGEPGVRAVLAGLVAACFIAGVAAAQPGSGTVNPGSTVGLPGRPDYAPSRCVAGTKAAVPEQTLPTVTKPPPPPLRQTHATYNIEYPHAEAELLVFPKARGAQLTAQVSLFGALFDSLGAVVVFRELEVPFFRVRFKASEVLETKAHALIGSSFVQSVRANGCVFPAQNTVSVNDPDFAGQWALTTIRMGEAWAVEKGDQQLVVAVMDSGFGETNPDLQHLWINKCEDLNHDGLPNDANGVNDPCSWELPSAPIDDFRGWNFYNDDYNLTDNMNHGTMVAGIIGAQPDNNLLIAGINFDVRLMDLKVLGSLTGYDGSVLKAFSYAIGHGARVINASWTGYGLLPEFEAQIEIARQHGILVVAAAGEGPTDEGPGYDLDIYAVYPCNFPEENVICVAATTRGDTLEPDSNFGAKAVALGAPGQSVMSTMGPCQGPLPPPPGACVGTQSGTSLAAPQVSGVAALLQAHCGWAKVAWLTNRLLDGEPLPAQLGGKTRSGARLDAMRALSASCPKLHLSSMPELIRDWLVRTFPRWIQPQPLPTLPAPPRAPDPPPEG